MAWNQRNDICLILILTSLLTCFHFSLSWHESTRLQCHIAKSVLGACNCRISESTIVVDCSAQHLDPHSPRIMMIFEKNTRATIDCHSKPITSSLPKFEFEHFPVVEITQCPLMRDTIHDLLEHAGLGKHVRKLHFASIEAEGLSSRHFHKLNIEILKLDFNKGLPSTLPQDLFGNIGNLKELEISGNKAEFPPNIFAPLKRLETIMLRNSNSHLPEGFLSNLPKLKTVALRSQLKAIPFDTFANSSRIQDLEISGTQLTELPGTLFVDQVELVDLKLFSNQLIILPDDIFVNTRKLRTLVLANNRLRSISSQTFRNTVNLNSLDVSNNRLLNISASVFTHTPNLHRIEMQNNHIEVLGSRTKPDIIASRTILRNLMYLDLSHNSIGTIDSDWSLDGLGLKAVYLTCSDATRIAGARNYKSVFMTNNRVPLKRLPARFLANMPELQMIFISLNLEQVSQDLFANSTKIQNVTITQNSLHELPSMLFADQVEMLYLDLTFNQLTALPDDIFQNTRKLYDLRLSYNKLTTVSRNLVNLVLICLSGNQLVTISNTAFTETRSLAFVDISNNQLSFCPSSHCLQESDNKSEAEFPFQIVESLIGLNMSNNFIRTFHSEWTRNQTALNYLDLSNNPITSFTEEEKSKHQGIRYFLDNPTLKRFLLRGNTAALENLPANFLSFLTGLEGVALNCQLETIASDIFKGSTQIKHIDISRNRLSNLPNKLFSDQLELLNLDLSHNQLNILADDLFEGTSRLVNLTLSYNHLKSLSRKTFSNLVSLEYLDLSHNYLVSISSSTVLYSLKVDSTSIEAKGSSPHDLVGKPGNESVFQDMDELRWLILSNNFIKNIDRMSECQKLNVLDLSYNKITAIDCKDLQSFSNNIHINLTHNAIQAVNFTELHTINFKRGVYIVLDNNPLQCDGKILDFLRFVSGEINTQPRDVLKVSARNLQCSSPPNLSGRFVWDLNPKELLSKFDSESSENKSCPLGCQCFIQPSRLAFLVDCSNGKFTEVPKLPEIENIIESELNMTNNKIIELPLATTPVYKDAVAIFAGNNSLSYILAENIPPKLMFLNVSHNKLQRLTKRVLDVFETRQVFLWLGNNPWVCDCSAKNLVIFIQKRLHIIDDLDDMQCLSGEKIKDLTIDSLCSSENSLVIMLSVLIATMGLTGGILAALFYKYRKEIKVWLYSKNLCLCLVTEEELDKNKLYDAFISYSHKDEDFIVDHLIPELEDGPTPFKLCLHTRDWIVGDFIPDQIVRSVHESRRTIIILSQNFIESVWAQMEFRAAYTAALNEGRSRIIVIIYDDIDISIDDLGSDWSPYLKMYTYVKWGDPWFWEKLRYALPHSSNINLRNSSVEMTPLR